MSFPNTQTSPAAAIPVRVVAGDGASFVTTGGDLYANVTTTGVIKASPGKLSKVIVNSKGTVASTVVVKDGTNVIATLDSLNNVGSYAFDVACLTNINVVITGTIPPNVTVTYQ